MWGAPGWGAGAVGSANCMAAMCSLRAVVAYESILKFTLKAFCFVSVNILSLNYVEMYVFLAFFLFLRFI